MPVGNAVAGLALYRDPERRIGAEASCAFCHVPPTGMATAWRWDGEAFVPPMEGTTPHHGAVRTGGISLAAVKVPQIRNMYEKDGFILTKPQSRAGFGYTSDGAIDTLPRFLSIRAFHPESDQEVADLLALILCFSGSEMPFDKHDPPGTVSHDAHAAVGKQFVCDAGAPADERLAQALRMADENRIGLVAAFWQDGTEQSATYRGGRFGVYGSDAQLTLEELQELGQSGAPAVITVVPRGTEIRIAAGRIDGNATGTFAGKLAWR
jgi:hypothetical protein